MSATGRKKNLLLCFDAFGTLFWPTIPIPTAYARLARSHKINCGNPEKSRLVGHHFREAFKQESKLHPNYGKAAGLGAEKWWANVIRNTFTPYLKPDQTFPEGLVKKLLHKYSTKDGYTLYYDVQPLFDMLREERSRPGANPNWKWDKTVVGVITNSDDRIPGILESFGLKVGPRRVDVPDERQPADTLDDDISFVVLSYDVGAEKPDRQIFDAAVESLGKSLAGNTEGLTVNDFEKVYVGDDLKKDYQGARDAGWDSILLERTYTREGAVREYGKSEVFSKSGEAMIVNKLTNLANLTEFRPEQGGEEI